MLWICQQLLCSELVIEHFGWKIGVDERGGVAGVAE